MTYDEIQIRILLILSELTATVSVPTYHYTHQPSDEQIKRDIQNCINNLEELKKAIK